MALGALGLAAPRPAFAQRAKAKRAIILWMAGGPSHIDTFDPKLGDSQGPFSSIATSVAGVRISEHLPLLAKRMKKLALIRSMTALEGNHKRASYLSSTGYAPTPGIEHPTLGAVLSSVTGEGPAQLPRFVAVGAGPQSRGFLPLSHAPFSVPKAAKKNPTLDPNRQPNAARAKRRAELMSALKTPPGELAQAHLASVERAQSMLRGAGHAFDLSQESARMHERYGEDDFGQGALLARRLLERDVKVVQVNMRGWDTHREGFTKLRSLSNSVDRGMSALLDDLSASGLLDETLVLWMGEFGRTPRINGNQGRGHHPRAYSVALAGGGVQGGQVIGATSADGGAVSEHPVRIPELFASIYAAFGITPDHRLGTPKGRPIAAVDQEAKPIAQLLG